MTIRKLSVLSLMLATIAILPACVSREQADAKLARACEAGVNALMTDGRAISSIKSTEFAPSAEGPGLRHVTLIAVEKDDWLETDSKFECIFDESWGPFKMHHTASVYQVRTGDQIYGKAGNNITGSVQDFVRLTDAMTAVMN